MEPKRRRRWWSAFKKNGVDDNNDDEDDKIISQRHVSIPNHFFKLNCYIIISTHYAYIINMPMVREIKTFPAAVSLQSLRNVALHYPAAVPLHV